MERDETFYYWNLSFCTDVYGLDTKKAITLARTQFTAGGKRRIQELQSEYIKAFCDYVLEKLKKKISELGENFVRYSFWLNCDDEQRKKFRNRKLFRTMLLL